MSVSFSSWLGASSSLDTSPANDATERAALAWRRIQHKPSSVAFRTNAGATIAAQTVRVEYDNVASPSTGNAGNAGRRGVVVFGIRGHSSLSDSDIKPGYRFVLNAEEFRCLDVIITLGEIQGLFEAV
jgi:hypothetical protein